MCYVDSHMQEVTTGTRVLDAHHTTQSAIWLYMASLIPLHRSRAAHHVEDGIHDDIDGDSSRLPPVPHRPHPLPVVSQEVIRQP